MITSTRKEITTVPQLVVPATINPQKVKFVNAGGEVIRIGGDASVSPTASFGLARLPDNPNVTRNIWEFTLNGGEEIWAVVAQNTSDLNVWVQSF
jgi:hypothetical protein